MDMQEFKAFKEQVNQLAVRANFIAPPVGPRNGEYDKISEDIIYELRVLVVKLNLCPESDEVNLAEMCESIKTMRRLRNIEAVLNAMGPNFLLSPPADLTKLEKKAKRYLNGDKYPDELIQHLGLEVFFEAQRKYAAIFAKLHSAWHASRHGAIVTANIGRIIQRTIATLSAGASILGSFSLAIPFIQAIVMVIPFGYAAARSWLNRSGGSDRAVASVLAGVGLVALCVSIAIPLAAFGIGAVMVAAGIYMDEVRPYFLHKRKLLAHTNDMAAIDARIAELQNDAENVELNQREKLSLLKSLTHFVILNPRITPEEMTTAKAIIQRGSLPELHENALLIQALDLHPEQSVYKFLLDANQADKQSLQEEIARITTEKEARFAGGINGIFTTIGAIMLAIPFPPVQIAGAVVLLVSSLVGVSLHYNLHGKLWNAIKDRVQKRRDAKLARESDTEMELVPHVELGSKLTNNSRMHNFFYKFKVGRSKRCEEDAVLIDTRRYPDNYITLEDLEPAANQSGNRMGPR
jgi:hypothetical protein